MIGAAVRSLFAQALAQLFRALRAGEEPFEQSAQVQPGATDYDGQMMAQVDFGEHLPRLAGIFAGGDVLRGIDNIEKTMRRGRELSGAGLGGADIKLAVHRSEEHT